MVLVVEEFKPEFLVMGARGMGEIKRFFIGSVSDYAIHHVTCPVMIVKKPM